MPWRAADAVAAAAEAGAACRGAVEAECRAAAVACREGGMAAERVAPHPCPGPRAVRLRRRALRVGPARGQDTGTCQRPAPGQAAAVVRVQARAPAEALAHPPALFPRAALDPEAAPVLEHCPAVVRPAAT